MYMVSLGPEMLSMGEPNILSALKLIVKLNTGGSPLAPVNHFLLTCHLNGISGSGYNGTTLLFLPPIK